MIPDEYISLVETRLRAEGVATTWVELGGAAVLVGYRPRFRFAWGATRLHLFTIVTGVQTVTSGGLAQFTRDALNYAIAQKGRLRGLQTGVAAIPVLVGVNVEPDAAAYAQRELPKRWAAFAWPAAVDLSSQTVSRHEGRVLVGGIYAQWIRSQTTLALPNLLP